MQKNGHVSVLEYINILLYNQILSKTVESLPDSYIDSRIEKFAFKLINSEQMDTRSLYDWQEFENKLYSGQIPKCRKKYVIENGKMYIKYSNDTVLEFLNYLRQIIHSKKDFKIFFKIPEVYNIFENLYHSDIFFYEYINVKGMPLNIKDVISILDILGLFNKYKEEFYLNDDCALLFYGIKNDVSFLDITVSPDILEVLKSKFKVEKILDNKYAIGNIIEISVKEKRNFTAIKKDVILLESLNTIKQRRCEQVGVCSDRYKSKRILTEIEKIKNCMRE